MIDFFSDPINVGITGANQQPGTDSLNVAGYGIIGNEGAVYLTKLVLQAVLYKWSWGYLLRTHKTTSIVFCRYFTVPITSTYFFQVLETQRLQAQHLLCIWKQSIPFILILSDGSAIYLVWIWKHSCCY